MLKRIIDNWIIYAGVIGFAALIVVWFYIQHLRSINADLVRDRDTYKALAAEGQNYIAKYEVAKKANEAKDAKINQLQGAINEKEPGCPVVPANYRAFVRGLSDNASR